MVLLKLAGKEWEGREGGEKVWVENPRYRATTRRGKKKEKLVLPPEQYMKKGGGGRGRSFGKRREGESTGRSAQPQLSFHYLHI